MNDPISQRALIDICDVTIKRGSPRYSNSLEPFKVGSGLRLSPDTLSLGVLL